MFKRMISAVMIIGLVGLLSASGRNELAEKSEITVASKFDTEGALLGNMIILVLENGGFEVVDRTELGPTDVVRKALETGEVDVYPEYTGNGNWFFADMVLAETGTTGRRLWRRSGSWIPKLSISNGLNRLGQTILGRLLLDAICRRTQI